MGSPVSKLLKFITSTEVQSEWKGKSYLISSPWLSLKEDDCPRLSGCLGGLKVIKM